MLHCKAGAIAPETTGTSRTTGTSKKLKEAADAWELCQVASAAVLEMLPSEYWLIVAHTKVVLAMEAPCIGETMAAVEAWGDKMRRLYAGAGHPADYLRSISALTRPMEAALPSAPTPGPAEILVMKKIAEETGSEAAPETAKIIVAYACAKRFLDGWPDADALEEQIERVYRTVDLDVPDDFVVFFGWASRLAGHLRRKPVWGAYLKGVGDTGDIGDLLQYYLQ